MNLLVMRFSAMGDVALLTPALIAISTNYPHVQITLVTRRNYVPFFYNIPNVNVVGFNLQRYKGIRGFWRLYNELEKLGPFDKIIDLHGSLRSSLFTLFYRFKKIPTFKINKGRREKKAQIRRNKKILTPLPHSVERYLKVFEKAGFPAKVRRGPWINVDPESKIFASEFFKSSNLKKKDGLWIGFAPFAGHQLKEWPFYKSINLIKILKTEFPGCEIFLFGSNEEIEKLKYLKKDNDNCHIVVGGDLGIQGEIGVMEKLDLLIGMDSSNIHIMALLKKPVIAIFGTTHPYSGFSPFGQEDTGVLQVDLPCRPCSIYGNTTCWRKDFACMEMIDPMDVAKRIKLIQNINTLW